MDKTIKILVDEHKNILKLVERLNKEVDNLEKNRNINRKFFIDSIGFIRNYADKFHHAKEEDILFKEFCKAAEKGEVHCNPTEQMLYEHDVGRGFVKGIEEGIEKNDVDKIVENARGYMQLIKEHIFKEDEILYPMIEQALTKEEKEKMLKEFIKIEKDREKEIKIYLNQLK